MNTRTTIALAALAAALTAVPLRAQDGTGTRERATLRAGVALHGRTADGTAPWASLEAGASTALGKGTLHALGEAGPATEAGRAWAAEAGYGFLAAYGRATMTTSLAFRLQSATGEGVTPMAGARLTVDVRIAGPLGAWASASIARPIVRTGGYVHTDWHGQGTLSLGLRLSL